MLDLLWAAQWLALNALGKATWREAKSFRHRNRTGKELEHVCDRVVDDLLAVKRWRYFSHRLLFDALSHHPLNMTVHTFQVEAPLATFVIPYMDGSPERQKGLELCLKSIAAEFRGRVRIIVAEQYHSDFVRLLRARFPTGYVSSVVLEREGPFQRSATLNLGVREAKTDIVVLHDGDTMTVKGYRDFVQLFKQSDYEVAWPFLMTFYLDAGQTEMILAGRPHCAMSCCRELESVSIIIRKSSFERIGGFDERFVGWGSEDNEFYDRATTLKVYPTRELFGVHAWHPLSHKDSLLAKENKRRLLEIRGIDPLHRIAELRSSTVSGWQVKVEAGRRK